jgi:aminoglycoside phosphotransferase (APT) family kinase protein
MRCDEHPRSGRNRLFLVDTDDGRRWLAKQSLTFPRAEAWFYSTAGPHRGVAPSCLLADIRTEVVVLEYLATATPLDRVARDDLAAALGHLPRLAALLATLHGALESLPGAPAARTAFPQLDPVEVEFWMDMGPGAQEMVADLQQNPKLGAALNRALAGDGTPGLIHGDLKLDNVLLGSREPRLVDWECCGRGAIETDLGAIIGSLVMIWCDRWSPQTASATPSLDDILAAASAFLGAYADRRELGLDRGRAAAFVAAWIVGRSWVESAFARRAVPSHGMRLVIAEELIDHPDLLFGNPA